MNTEEKSLQPQDVYTVNDTQISKALNANEQTNDPGKNSCWWLTMICVFIDFLDAKLEITGSESTINLSESKTIPAVVLKSNDSSINKSPTNKKNRNSEPE